MLFLTAAILLTPIAGTADARTAKLTPIVPAGVVRFAPGMTKVAARSSLYRPSSAGALAPLLVILHGAGGSAKEAMTALAPHARRCGCMVLAVKSAGGSWDLSAAVRSDQGDEARDRGADEAAIGVDAVEIERALGAVLADPRVDRHRVGLIGFSAGAGYALTLGLANSNLFPAVVAIAPSYFLTPRASDPRQRILVEHGRNDPVLSFAFTRDTIVPALKKLGVGVTFAPSNGEHHVYPDQLEAAVAFIIGPRRH